MIGGGDGGSKRLSKLGRAETLKFDQTNEEKDKIDDDLLGDLGLSVGTCPATVDSFHSHAHPSSFSPFALKRRLRLRQRLLRTRWVDTYHTVRRWCVGEA